MDTPITISDKKKPARQTSHLTIGALIFPRMNRIDSTGPFEVLSRIPDSAIHVIAKTKSPVRDIQGLILAPEMTIAEAPEFDAAHAGCGARPSDQVEHLRIPSRNTKWELSRPRGLRRIPLWK